MEKRTRSLLQSVLNKDSKEKKQGIITESPIKNLWKLFYYGKKNIFWFVNNTKYHQRQMGLKSIKIEGGIFEVVCL